jgi:hypothetical protein
MSALPLAVILTAPTEPQSIGGVIPITVEVRNVGDRPIWMVGVMDGSELGLRYPRYQPNIVGAMGATSEPLPLPDMVAPLRLQDFLRLLPGQGFDPTIPQKGATYLPLNTFTSFRPLHPGRYEFRLSLSTDSPQDEDWLGIIGYPGQDQVLSRLAEVPRLQIESNTAVVEVR